jgi:hypothetical protein
MNWILNLGALQLFAPDNINYTIKLNTSAAFVRVASRNITYLLHTYTLYRVSKKNAMEIQ